MFCNYSSVIHSWFTWTFPILIYGFHLGNDCVPGRYCLSPLFISQLICILNIDMLQLLIYILRIAIFLLCQSILFHYSLGWPSNLSTALMSSSSSCRPASPTFITKANDTTGSGCRRLWSQSLMSVPRGDGTSRHRLSLTKYVHILSIFELTFSFS